MKITHETMSGIELRIAEYNAGETVILWVKMNKEAGLKRIKIVQDGVLVAKEEPLVEA